jgi:hypothetical protein
LAKAGEAMKKVRPITPTSAAIRFTVKPNLSSIRHYGLTSLDLTTSPQGCDLGKE